MVFSPTFSKELLLPRSGESECVLITLTHEDWAEPLTLCTARKQIIDIDEETNRPVYGIISRGVKYVYVGLNVILPSSAADQAPEASFQFSHVGREVGQRLKLTADRYPRMVMEIVATSAPDVVERKLPKLQLRTTNWNRTQGEVTAFIYTASNQPCSPYRFDKASFPNLFVEQ